MNTPAGQHSTPGSRRSATLAPPGCTVHCSRPLGTQVRPAQLEGLGGALLGAGGEISSRRSRIALRPPCVCTSRRSRIVSASLKVFAARASEARLCTFCPTMITDSSTSWRNVCAIQATMPSPPGFSAGPEAEQGDHPEQIRAPHRADQPGDEHGELRVEAVDLPHRLADHARARVQRLREMMPGAHRACGMLRNRHRSAVCHRSSLPPLTAAGAPSTCFGECIRA